jgi:hypothetical protein
VALHSYSLEVRHPENRKKVRVILRTAYWLFMRVFADVLRGAASNVLGISVANM